MRLVSVGYIRQLPRENISSFTLDLFVVTINRCCSNHGKNKYIKRKAGNVFTIIQKQNKLEHLCFIKHEYQSTIVEM